MTPIISIEDFEEGEKVAYLEKYGYLVLTERHTIFDYGDTNTEKDYIKAVYTADLISEPFHKPYYIRSKNEWLDAAFKFVIKKNLKDQILNT